MIELAADKVASWINRNTLEPATSQQVLSYALMIYFNGLAILSVSLLVGFLTGEFLDTLLAITAFGMLRAFSGGNHFPTATACFYISVGIFTLLPHIPTPEIWVHYMLMSVCLFLTLRYAPNTQHDPIYGNKLLPFMKWISFLIVAMNFILASWVVTLALFAQCVTLIPLRRR